MLDDPEAEEEAGCDLQLLKSSPAEGIYSKNQCKKKKKAGFCF